MVALLEGHSAYKALAHDAERKRLFDEFIEKLIEKKKSKKSSKSGKKSKKSSSKKSKKSSKRKRSGGSSSDSSDNEDGQASDGSHDDGATLTLLLSCYFSIAVSSAIGSSVSD